MNIGHDDDIDTLGNLPLLIALGLGCWLIVIGIVMLTVALV